MTDIIDPEFRELSTSFVQDSVIPIAIGLLAGAAIAGIAVGAIALAEKLTARARFGNIVTLMLDTTETSTQ